MCFAGNSNRIYQIYQKWQNTLNGMKGKLEKQLDKFTKDIMIGVMIPKHGKIFYPALMKI